MSTSNVTVIAPDLSTQAKLENRTIVVTFGRVKLYGVSSLKPGGTEARIKRLERAFGAKAKVTLAASAPKGGHNVRGITAKDLAAALK